MWKCRSHFLLLCALAIATGSAPAQDFPTKPIRIIAPYPPGGSSDITLRTLADRMRTELGQPIIIENKPGAGTGIASDYVAKTPADGYTLLFAGSSFTMLPAIAKVNYDPVKDFAPISQVLDLAIFLVVRADLPVHSVAELVAYLKAKPGKINYGSVGTGSITHFQMEQFKAMTHTEPVHVPYKGSAQALTDMVGGRLQINFDGYPTAGPYIRNGTFRALAVAMPRRASILPDVPTMAEAGLPGYDAIAWSGLMAPAGTPRTVINRLNSAVAAALRDPIVLAKLRGIGAEPASSTPEELAARVRRETSKWAETAHALGIQPE